MGRRLLGVAVVLAGLVGLLSGVSAEVAGGQTTQPAGKIGNRVWDDRNRNGAQTQGEPGLEGVSVELLNASGRRIAGGKTGPGGWFGFPNLKVDTCYLLAVGILPGYRYTTPDSPNAGTSDRYDSDINPSTGRTQQICLTAANPMQNNWDTGLVTDTAAPRIAFNVHNFWDANGNGRQDAGEGNMRAVRLTAQSDPFGSGLLNVVGGVDGRGSISWSFFGFDQGLACNLLRIEPDPGNSFPAGGNVGPVTFITNDLVPTGTQESVLLRLCMPGQLDTQVTVTGDITLNIEIGWLGRDPFDV